MNRRGLGQEPWDIPLCQFGPWFEHFSLTSFSFKKHVFEIRVNRERSLSGKGIISVNIV